MVSQNFALVLVIVIQQDQCTLDSINEEGIFLCVTLIIPVVFHLKVTTILVEEDNQPREISASTFCEE